MYYLLFIALAITQNTLCDGDLVDQEQFNLARSSKPKQFKRIEEKNIDGSNFVNFGSIEGDNELPKEV